MLGADGVAEPCDGPAGAEKIAELMLAVQRGGVPDDVIMNVLFVGVRGNEKGVSSVQKPVSYTHLDVYKRQQYIVHAAGGVVPAENQPSGIQLIPAYRMRYGIVRHKQAVCIFVLLCVLLGGCHRRGEIVGCLLYTSGWMDPKQLQLPKTGDSSVLGLWGISLCASLAGCLVLTTWQIRRRREEEALQIIEK